MSNYADKCLFPSGQHAKEMLHGEQGGVSGSLAWSAWRAGLLALGMYLGGERKGLLKKAAVGSLGVEALVVACVAASDNPTLPSAQAAMAGDPLAILATYLTRSSVVAASLYLSGQREHVWRNALAGAAAVEASVLVWASHCRDSQPKFLPG